jgi:hypothetical protein
MNIDNENIIIEDSAGSEEEEGENANNENQG